MKKIMMTLVAVAMATTMNAQVYVGGGVGLAVESYDGESNTVWSILPEIGYNINEKWAVGTVSVMANLARATTRPSVSKFLLMLVTLQLS
jgi:hypothetical protein